MYLSNETDMPIPATIFTKVFTGVVIVNDLNRFNFVRFDNEHEVKFFKEIDFIIDFDKYKEFTDEQLEEEIRRMRSGRIQNREASVLIEVEVTYLPSVTVFTNVEALQTL